MAETIIYIDPSVLKVHPRNSEFYDDVDGVEFDRLVESIRDHGVLTPLRVTKDMTIVSGHQRTRAALKAGCNSVPVIVDDSDDDNDILMKLIETNFGRMKNDPIKQAKWLDEYTKLRGTRQGSAGKGNLEADNRTPKLEEIAKELGMSISQLKAVKSLLKLDPAFQALISDGKINATTGFKILSKLSPEEQTRLLDKLPDDVKFSAKSIEEYISQMREELTGNANKAMQERDKLVGEKERLIKENNELRAGVLPVSAETQSKIDKLEQEKREFYEKSQRLSKETERLRGEIDKAMKAKALAESKANGGDDAVIALENQVQELQDKLQAQERRANDLEFQLEEKDGQIVDLRRESKEGFMRKALRVNETPEEMSQRELDSLISSIQIAIGQFQASAEGAMTQIDSFYKINKPILKVLVETCSQAINAGTRLKVALMAAGGAGNDDDDNDPNYTLDDSDFELTNDFEIGMGA